MNNQMPFGLPNMPQFQGQMPGMPGATCTCGNEIDRLNNKITRLERQVRALEQRVLRLENPNQGIMPLNQGSGFQSDMYMI
jgi:hypothetical protein